MARKPRSRGRQLTPADEELIVQTFALCGNKSQVARRLNFSRPTVAKVLKKAETNRELQVARGRALDELAGQVHGKTVEILESISPADLESGRELIRNDEGQVVRKVEWGPSLLQKVTAAAILTDKTKVIEETKTALEADAAGDPNALPLPGTVQGALKQLGQRLKRLRILDVQFDSKQPELTEKLQDAVAAAEAHPEIDEADYEEIKLDDFDNPMGDAGEI